MFLEKKSLLELDSPGLILLKDKVRDNIEEMIRLAGSPDRLMPHVKTNKMLKVIQMMLKKNIQRFKAATIAEAELAAMSGARFVLIAHQLVGPKVQRLLKLIKKYPNTQFASLIDCEESANDLDEKFKDAGLIAKIYIDINNGMNRTGIEVGENLERLLEQIHSQNQVKVLGFYVYDGHNHDPNLEIRRKIAREGFGDLQSFIQKFTLDKLEIVSGGSPSFTAHLSDGFKTLSPGTSVFWDWNYGEKYEEQHFEYAVLLLTRVISKPKDGLITVDLGHKAVGAENPINFRVKFPNNPDLQLISQSEEHGVLSTEFCEKYQVGDILLGVPYHVCPTVNLYDYAFVFDNGRYVEDWEILGRKRKITV